MGTKELELPEEAQDDVAISVSRLFAQLFLKALGEMGCGKVTLTLDDAASVGFGGSASGAGSFSTAFKAGA